MATQQMYDNTGPIGSQVIYGSPTPTIPYYALNPGPALGVVYHGYGEGTPSVALPIDMGGEPVGMPTAAPWSAQSPLIYVVGMLIVGLLILRFVSWGKVGD